ncbi:MAG: hypothetical protein GY756_08755 [bacterium]|nr:hypothetical protein [bacterium]
MRKTIITLFALIVLSSVIFAAGFVPLKSDYPHWNFNNKATYQKLVRINNFIEKNKNRNVLAVFDWDGTRTRAISLKKLYLVQ